MYKRQPLLVKSYLWDPPEPMATRLLAVNYWKHSGKEIDKHFYFIYDAIKNVDVYKRQHVGGSHLAHGDVIGNPAEHVSQHINDRHGNQAEQQRQPQAVVRCV